jgi:hypothetical protein
MTETTHPARGGGGYERRDLNLRMVAAFLAAMIVTVLVVLALMVWVFDVFSLRDTRQQTPPSPLAKGRQLPPEPRLQVNGPADLRALRAQEDAQLNSYGWMDRKAETVHIPIAQAMKLLAERGLPAPGKPGGKP